MFELKCISQKKKKKERKEKGSTKLTLIKIKSLFKRKTICLKFSWLYRKLYIIQKNNMDKI